MSTSDKGTAFLEELKAFLAFLRSLWGVLTGITAVFPLANAFTNVLPLSTDFHPQLVTAITTLVTLFVILQTFSQRLEFEVPKGVRSERRRRIQRQVGYFFAIGVLALGVYLVAPLVYFRLPFSVWEALVEDPAMLENVRDLSKLLLDVVGLVCYVIFFALTTKAFMVLGMIEFYQKER
jgi:hypothetical protein